MQTKARENSRTSRPRKRLSAHKRSEYLTAYLFIAPDLIGLIVFVILPILFAVNISFFKWDMVSERIFVGFDNYLRMFRDANWWGAMGRTLKLSLCYVPLLFALSLLVATLVSQMRGKAVAFIKSSFLMTYAITAVIASTLWMFLFNEKRGYLNRVLNFLGMESQGFLGSTDQALFCIVVVLLWINVGYNMILFLSAIKEIPTSYYEAATIDGASRWKTFWSITFPLIKKTSIFVLITTTIASFQVLDLVLVMTKGGPARSTEVGALYIYDRSFNMMEMGYGSALSVCLFLILLIFSIVQMRLSADKD